MSRQQESVQTPANLVIFNDTAIGAGIDLIKSSSVKLYYCTVVNPNPNAVYLKIWGTTAFGSIVLGTTPADIVLFVPGSTTVNVNFMVDAASPGTTFNQASAACVQTGGTTGTVPPASAVNFTLAYV
jgi:hypothetical protein